MRPILSRAALAAAALSLPFLTAPDLLGAQATTVRPDARGEVRIQRLPGGVSIAAFGFGDRPALGLTLADATRGETDGVRIESVNPDGPAAKAGLKAGDLITAINGVSLQVNPSDAADPALSDLAQRRLQRTLAKARAGDNVELRVSSGGQSRTVNVKTVTMAELSGNAVTRAAGSRREDDEKRGAIGLSIGASGNSRDTLGLFVNAVVANGPAEKAGLVEGERIASVNGVDVRVPREDVEDFGSASARANRFTREVQKVAPGGTVTLRVYGGGRYRDVTVTTVRPSELPSQGFRMSFGDGFGISLPRGGSSLMPARPMDGFRLSPDVLQRSRTRRITVL